MATKRAKKSTAPESVVQQAAPQALSPCSRVQKARPIDQRNVESLGEVDLDRNPAGAAKAAKRVTEFFAGKDAKTAPGRT